MIFLRNTFKLFATNARTAILFELVFRVLLASLFIPLSFGMIDLAMSFAGISYISDANLSLFLQQPVTWLFACLSIVLIASCSLFEMCALVIVMQASKENRTIGVFALGRRAFASARMIVRPRNWLLIPFVLILVPLAHITVTSSVITEFRPPEFIMDYIWQNPLLSLVFFVAIALFCTHAFYLSFGIHFFTLCRQPWMKARRSSKHLLEKNKWRLLRRLLAIEGLIIALTFAVGFLIDAGSNALFDSSPSLPLLIVCGLTLLALIVFASCAFLPLSYAALSATFYELAAKRGVAIPYNFTEHTPSKRRRAGRVIAGAGIVALAFFSLTAYAHIHGVFEPSPAPPTQFEITAHRGGSRTAPENTLAAFQQAIDEGADWVELDVQQTADGVLMVMHDSSLKRTTGLDKEFWQVTYDEIKNLDNGSWFSPEFAHERVCTLEEALALCKGKIKMNIEVKPDGHGVDLEKKTVDLINKYDMKDQAAIASITYGSLVKVKNADPSMATMYDMTLAYGLISEIEYVDYFSVDDFFVTQELVNNVRESGKIIYAWTVNDPRNIARLVEYGIDGLVTDDVELVREIAASFATWEVA